MTNNQRFAGRSAFVTGAGSGIGRSIALQMAAEGALVAILDLEQQKVEAVRDEIEAAGAHAISFAGDVSDFGLLESTIAQAAKEFGTIDVLVNNAGVPGAIAPIEKLSLDAWSRSLNVTLTATFVGTKAVLPYMLAKGKGVIVNTASVSGMGADIGLSAYNAAKAGVINFTRATAVEYSRRGIRANCVCPAAIATPPILAMFEGDGSAGYAERWEAMAAAHPMGRMGQPEEIAEVACFLASDAASFVSGAAYMVDGGLMAWTGMPPLPVGTFRPGMTIPELDVAMAPGD